MIEKIQLNALTKNYINNHDVICRGVHCVYRERISTMYGNTLKPYIVLNYPVKIEFWTLKELKDFIKKS